MKNQFKYLPGMLVFALCHSRVFANGFMLADQDAFRPRAVMLLWPRNDPSAIYYNPAGIAQLTNDNFRGGIYAIYASSSYKPPGGNITYHSWDNLSASRNYFTSIP